MDNPGNNRRPVWNPGPSGASHNQYIQSAAAESSTSVSESTSRRFPALAAAANPYPSNTYQQSTSDSQSHYQGMFGLTGTHGQTYQPAQSSYGQSATGDYRELPSGSGSAQYGQSSRPEFTEMPSASGSVQPSFGQSTGRGYRDNISGSGSIQSSYSQSSGTEYRELPSGSRSAMSTYGQSTAGDYQDVPTGSVSAHSSYSQSSAEDYRDMPTGSDEASSYPLLRIGEGGRVQAQPVNSTTVSQSGYQPVHQLLVDEGNQLTSSPVDSTVSQSASGMNREPEISNVLGNSIVSQSSLVMNREPGVADGLSGGRHSSSAQILFSSTNRYAPVQASLPSCTQSEVSTSGGSPQGEEDMSHDQGDLDLNQVHGEAEPQDRHSPRVGISREVDMDEAVSSISDQGLMPERPRVTERSSHATVDESDDVSGEPDTTQEDDDDEDMREDNGYSEDMSNVDEAEAVQSTVVARGSRSAPAPGPSHPLPSMSRVSDSDRRPAMHLAPHARMTSLTASLFSSNQSFRVPESPGIPFPTSMIQSPSQMIPSIANEIPVELIPTQFSANQVAASSSTFSANQLAGTGTSSTLSANQLAPTMSSTDGAAGQYGESEQESAVDSSAMGDNLCNGVMPSLPEYGASSSSNIVEDDQQPGTSKQSPKKVRKSTRIQEMEDDKPYWHREEYLPRPYDTNKLWCDVCQRTFDTECDLHRLSATVDKIVFSRAWSSLPSCLQIYRLANSEQLGVFAKRPISKFTQFGPFVGELTEQEIMLTNSGMPIMVEQDGDVLYYDTSDENKCNWMMFVRNATNFAEQNLVMYQYGQEIYFSVTKPIEHRGELKVWYANHYADRHNLNRLEPTEQDIDILEETEFKFHCFECSKKFRTAVALQKHLFEHDEETGSSKVESTWDSLLEQESRKPVSRKQKSQMAQIRKKYLAARKLKEQATDTASSPLYHWKKRSTNIYLNKTLKKYHKRTDGKKSAQSMYRKTGDNENKNEWTCVSCDLTFDNASVLNLHTLTHAAENVGQTDMPNFLTQAAENVLQDEIRKLTLQIGTETFGGPNLGQGQDGLGLGTSQETHTLACPVCSAQFTQMLALVEHAAEHGIAKKQPNYHRPFKCDKCWKAFTTQERLTAHFLCHGPDENKQFPCMICGKRFLNNSARSCHLKTHSLHKYYECPLCRMGFDHAAAMREHSQVHLSPEGLFNCPKCDKKFSEFLVLKKHIRGFHNSGHFQCDVCEKVFPREDKLRLHKLSHSSVREFMCETCGRQFKRKDKLKDHIKRLHSVERQVRDLERSLKPPRIKFIPKVSPTDYQRFIYKCHLCLLGFKRRGMLVNHLANKHPGVKIDSVPELNLPILKTQRDYYCKYCDKVYKSSSKRKAHILKNHPGAELPLSARKKIPPEETLENGDNPTYSQTVGSITTMPHNCEHCHKQYASKAKLMQHQRRKHVGLVPPAPERIKRDKIDLSQLQQTHEATANVIHVVEAYNTDGQATEVAAGADLLTQAMSELTQTIQEYRQNTPGAPELYQVSARLAGGPPTMVQIQTGNGSPGSTIELTSLSQALSQFSPGQSHIQVAVSGTGQQIQIPIVTQALQQFSPGLGPIQVSVAGSGQPIQIVPKPDPGATDQAEGVESTPEGAGAVTTQAVSYQPLNLVSGTYIPKTWTNYTYK